ncbi:ABC transporter ATP-binding protein [Virgisporangium aurantiacum]|uniref:Multidrug ABC transporter ATP-binding protein n=1 Tax=Virgisporangium aurantiacum TaxID=175570 RepID=A0A8J3Z2K1_9ACTN|nr:multidrug ABC transporter ATP-binding protein [Virgisporangium aurantiacum]
MKDGSFATIRRGLRATPEIFTGIRLTLLLALFAAGGRIVVPMMTRYTVDHGLTDTDRVLGAVGVALLVVVSAGVCSWAMNTRLVRASETALAALRVKAFDHIHRLSSLTQHRERRGSLVARVSSDVDIITQFTQAGGVTLLISLLQMVIATVVMLWYSWVLALVVLACFVPAALLMRAAQRRVAARYRQVRRDVGEMYGVLGETAVGTVTIRSYGVERLSQRRLDDAVDTVRRTQTSALPQLAVGFSVGELVAGLSTAAVVVCGLVLSTSAYRDGDWSGWFGTISLGELLAFVLLITFFSRPIQQSVEILNEAQNAVAGWRRVLEILDTPVDVAPPAEPVPLPAGPVRVEVAGVEYTYPTGPRVLHGIDVDIPAGAHVAVVGATGSGKSTFAKLLTHQLVPQRGAIRLNGVGLADLAPESLYGRVAIVPQDCFLFDTTIDANLRLARPECTDDDLLDALSDLDLISWLGTLPHGLRTRVGQRGEELSAGERQLVALVRTYLVRPDLLILDEATSAVDPATDVRLQRALRRVAGDQTTITIAHRMATAETADRVLVFDDGTVVEQGRHGDLVARGGVYAGLHRAWTAMKAEPFAGPPSG